MQHLSPETLARLVDEPPLSEEAAHLRSCLACRRELDAFRTQTASLASLAAPALPAGAWAELEARLLEEGLIRAPAPAAPPRVVPRWRVPLRAAAAVALFVLGGATGAALWARFSATSGGEAVPGPLADGGAPAHAVEVAPLEVGAPVVEPLVFPADEPAAARPAPGAVFAASGETRAAPAPRPVRRPAPRRLSPAAEQARRELGRAQADYLAALRRYAELADPASGADEATRLQALDGLVATTRSALNMAPDDPVINGYHLAAVSERDAVLRQIASRSESAWF